jgi:putative oxidoreductase
MNLALLILRVSLGLLLAGHGIQKLSKHLGGHGIAAEAADLEAHGLRGGKPAAALSGLTQLAAGMSIATGLLTPLAAPPQSG